MKNYIIIFLFIYILTGCSSDDSDKLPVTPELSSTEITVEEGRTTQVEIIKGEAPFTVQSSDKTIATVSVNGNTITVEGIMKGTVSIKVTGKDQGEAKINVTVKEDRYKDFISDATLRYERAGMAVIKNTDGDYLFYRDRGILFGSEKNKLGYGKRDGSSYFILEWEGDNSIGEKSNPSIRDVLGVTAIDKIEIIKADNGILWIVFKEKTDSAESRLVQKF